MLTKSLKINVKGLSGKIQKNNEIRTIKSWGPQFRVSFDLKINKLVHGGPVWGWSTVIVFKADDKDGGRIPALFIHRMMKFGFYISNSVNGNGNHAFLYTKFHLNNWINFVLEQSESGDGKVYYTVTIDGKQVHRVENKQPRTFSNVKILAGPDTNVADANYRNLMYETLPDFGTVKKINGNNLIGCINSWGPLFRVSFDLKINKLVRGDPVWGWSNVIVFKADDKDGSRIPALFIHRMMKFGLYISNSVNGNGNHHFLYTKFHLNKWMKFVLEQSEARDGKVYYTVTIDGKQIHRVENKQPRTFTDVKIFAGPSWNVADGNYRNLVYETIPKKELQVKIE